MYCPRCAQERISDDTSFCSRCGFLLTGTQELLLTDGVLVPGTPLSAVGQKESPRWQGIKMGLVMIMLLLVILPVLYFIFRAFDLNLTSWPVGILIFLLGGGGLLRIAYALMFESKACLNPPGPPAAFPGKQKQNELNAADQSSYIPPPPLRPGQWNTNDLEPSTITGATTRPHEAGDRV